MEQKNKILIHACCGICSGYPISILQEMGYDVVNISGGYNAYKLYEHLTK